MSVTDATLNILVQAISEQVAANVKKELAEQFSQQARHVQPKLLNVKDAGVYLGRTEQSIQSMIYRKELAVVRVGRRVHLDRFDLDTWIEKNKY